MGEEIRNAIKGNWWFYVLAGIAIALIITAFFIPPMAVIDASVIAAVGEIFAFSALGTVIKAIDKGKSATVTHGETSLTVGEKEE